MCCFFDQIQVKKFEGADTQKSRQNMGFGEFSDMFARTVRTLLT